MNYSIVIPIYKRGEIIQNCLKSISEQSLKPCEIIIVDNNVDIEDSNILRNNVNDFKLNNNINIRILSSPKNSGAIARNIGASVSVGEIIAFLDSDVILDKNYYKTLTKLIQNNQRSIFFSSIIRQISVVFMWFSFNMSRIFIHISGD